MRHFFDRTCTIKRQTYTNGKSSFSNVATSVFCYIEPIDQNFATFANVGFGIGWRLVVENATDLQEGDQVVVNSVTYVVKGVREWDRGAFPYKEAAIVEPGRV